MMSFKIKVISDLPDYLADSLEVIRAFNPYIIIDNNESAFLKIETKSYNDIFLVEFKSSFASPFKDSLTATDLDYLLYKRLTKRFLKNCLYKYISAYLETNLPYGSLTGVRPTSIIYQLNDEFEDKATYLEDNFFVEKKRAKLLVDVVKNQQSIISHNDNEIDIFISIPFCPTRCSYCSFISQEISKVKDRLPNYFKTLVFEVRNGLEFIDKTQKNVRSIYIGGGTPTSIPLFYLESLLKELSSFKVEFTVEAGRPDTIDDETLNIMADYGVNRISINPQSLNDKTLKEIGRNHSVEDFFNAYSLASKYSFIKNIDIIVGLPNENEKEIVKTLEGILALSPENLTVHTLSLKRGGLLKHTKTLSDFREIKPLMDMSIDMIDKEKYIPYYLYRQKNMVDNLENIGFSKKGFECIYNVDIMEDTHSIMGFGAGAMSKRVNSKENRIERLNNPKDINYYLDRFNDILISKEKLFKGNNENEQ